MYAFDRGGDRGKLYDKFLEKGKERLFVILLGKSGGPVHGGVKKNHYALAAMTPCPRQAGGAMYEDGKPRLNNS